MPCLNSMQGLWGLVFLWLELGDSLVFVDHSAEDSIASEALLHRRITVSGEAGLILGSPGVELGDGKVDHKPRCLTPARWRCRSIGSCNHPVMAHNPESWWLDERAHAGREDFDEQYAAL